jgi:glutamine amidotransferase
MVKPQVAVIDYGIGNLLSVSRGLEHCGAIVRVTSDPDAIFTADKVILPGVGAFGDGMAGLVRLGLHEVILEVAKRDMPLLGICLGMQMLMEESEEFGKTSGLGLIEGRVLPIPCNPADGNTTLKIPHIGWNALLPSTEKTSWDETLLAKTPIGSAVYFVHSFMALPTHTENHLAYCQYGGHAVTAAIRRGNVFGCQFHPEKSGEIGLQVLRTFLDL